MHQYIVKRKFRSGLDILQQLKIPMIFAFKGNVSKNCPWIKSGKYYQDSGLSLSNLHPPNLPVLLQSIYTSLALVHLLQLHNNILRSSRITGSHCRRQSQQPLGKVRSGSPRSLVCLHLGKSENFQTECGSCVRSFLWNPEVTRISLRSSPCVTGSALSESFYLRQCFHKVPVLQKCFRGDLASTDKCYRSPSIKLKCFRSPYVKMNPWVGGCALRES